jgi:hypothetical protein
MNITRYIDFSMQYVLDETPSQVFYESINPKGLRNPKEIVNGNCLDKIISALRNYWISASNTATVIYASPNPFNRRSRTDIRFEMNQSNRLITLPLEIRECILFYILPTQTLYNFLSVTAPRYLLHILLRFPILRVCRSLRIDALTVLARKNIFSTSGLRTSILFLNCIGPAGRASLLKLEIGAMRVPNNQPTTLENFQTVQAPYLIKLGSLLGDLTALSEITVYMDARLFFRDPHTKKEMSAEAHWTVERATSTKTSWLEKLVEGFDALRKDENRRVRVLLKWIGVVPQFGLMIHPEVVALMIAVTEALSPDEACLPHGSYGPGAERLAGCLCR